MNIRGRECRVQTIWCDKHHFSSHWIFFIKRDYDNTKKSHIPYVVYSAVCIACYNKDYEMSQYKALAEGKKFDSNRYAYDAPMQKAMENDWQALWTVKLY